LDLANQVQWREDRSIDLPQRRLLLVVGLAVRVG
jgi:hypothetical protein